MITQIESWRRVWREGICPSLSTLSLRELLKSLETDDPRLLQGATTTPPPLQCVQDWPVERACLISYCGVIDGGGFFASNSSEKPNLCAATVMEVEEFFAKICFECDARLGEPAACRYFLNWWDDSPREEVFREMISEVRRELAFRDLKEEADKV